jgi:WhiB family redox-sensing transcriptional regulator
MTGGQDPRPGWSGQPVPAWHNDGACRGVHLDIFFEARYEELARRVCRSCPVRSECRAWSIDAGSSLHGVWGALTWGERDKIRKARRREGAA